MPTHKSFIMTIANPHPSDMDGLRRLEPLCSTLYVALEHETHYHLQCYWTIKKDQGNKSFKFFRDFFPKKKIVSYTAETDDLDISVKDTAWIKAASGTRAYNHEYIVRGLHKDGTSKSFSEVIYNKNLSGTIETTPALVRVVKRMREGAHMDDLIMDDDNIEASAKSMTYLKHVQSILERKRAKKNYIHMKLEDFLIETPREHNFLFTVFWGMSGIFKTKFAEAHFKNPITVKSIEHLRDRYIPGHTDGIILDDMDFSDRKEWTRENILCLLDFYAETTVKCRYKDFIKPANVEIIATSNYPNVFGDLGNLPEIAGRIQVYHLNGPHHHPESDEGKNCLTHVNCCIKGRQHYFDKDEQTRELYQGIL